MGLNEASLLNLRVKYLVPEVSEFHVFELDHTFQGDSRTPELFETVKRLRDQGYEISHHFLRVPREVLKKGQPWAVDSWGRFQQGSRFLGQDCLLLLCDLDEIPSQQQVRIARDKMKTGEVLSLVNVSFHRSSQWVLRYDPPSFPIAIRSPIALGEVRELESTRVGCTSHLRRFPGAHLSYWNFSASEMRKKFSSFSHSSMATEERSSDEYYRYCTHFGLSFRGHTSKPGFGLIGVFDPKTNEVTRALAVVEQENAIPVKFPPVPLRLAASENLSRLLDNKSHIGLEIQIPIEKIVVLIFCFLVRQTKLVFLRGSNRIKSFRVDFQRKVQFREVG